MAYSGKASKSQVKRMVACGIPERAARLFSYFDAEVLLRRNALKQPLHEVVTLRNDPGLIANYRAMPYEMYLRTEWWSRIRRAAIARAGYRCEKCKQSKPLDVHHLTYERLGTEADTDLQALCRDCHAAVHLNA